MRPDQLERRLQERLDALGPAARAELRVMMLPDFDRADRIGEFGGYPDIRTFAELLIDYEEDRTLRAVLVGMLREADKKANSRRAAASAARHALGGGGTRGTPTGTRLVPASCTSSPGSNRR